MGLDITFRFHGSTLDISDLDIMSNLIKIFLDAFRGSKVGVQGDPKERMTLMIFLEVMANTDTLLCII